MERQGRPLGRCAQNQSQTNYVLYAIDRVFALLPAKLVDNILKVVFRSIGIVGLNGRLVVLVDQVLVIFGRAWLDPRFRTMRFNTIIEACEIRLRGWGLSPGDHRKGTIV